MLHKVLRCILQHVFSDLAKKKGQYMYVKGHCQPAARVIAALGGVSRTAELLKLPKSNVSRWASAASGNGKIPRKHHERVLELCHVFGIKMNARDLV
tara:strand:+ start:199 stop:489 length:291 start_codon:yes stop_codon:yes gene_type:complete